MSEEKLRQATRPMHPLRAWLEMPAAPRLASAREAAVMLLREAGLPELADGFDNHGVSINPCSYYLGQVDCALTALRKQIRDLRKVSQCVGAEVRAKIDEVIAQREAAEVAVGLVRDAIAALATDRLLEAGR